MSAVTFASAGYVCHFVGGGGGGTVVVVQEQITGSVLAQQNLVGNLSCDGQTMTDLTIVRGDSRNYQITILEADLVTPVDIDAPAVLRFAVKRFSAQYNDAAMIFKTSYDPAEIQITDGPNGVALVKVFAGDTQNASLGDYCWDLDLTRRGVILTSAGSIDVVAGSPIITGNSLALTDVLPGDVLAPSGTGAPNQKDLVIIAVGGQGGDNDPGAGNLLTDYDGWTTEAGVSFDIYRGDRKTPTGLSGTFTIAKDSAT